MKMFPLNNNKIIEEIALFCLKNNIKIYAVGGYVRDALLGIESKDIDLLFGSDIEKVAAHIKRKYKAKIEYFKPFLTYRCFFNNNTRIDLARFRSEKYSGSAVLPAVIKAGSIKEDLKRRDFSINALGMNVRPDGANEIIDLFGGRKDIKDGRVKILHNKSFIDDPTRIFRAAKFCARFNWRPDALTLNLIKRAVKKDLPALLSRERIKNELFRILEEKNPEAVFVLLEDWDMLKYIHREFRVFKNIKVLSDPEKKLALMACKMKTSGLGFLKGLELNRDSFRRLKEVVLINNLKEAPKKSIDEFEKSILKILNPRLSESALAPLMLNGFDLKKMSIEQKSKYSEILSAAARAQWKGVFKNQREALLWLKKYCRENT
ncbi:MAG: CCA tRNA nucleotidyltransferase [Elusimicrobiales bacterium]|nr:CCA tRNA nucleotidyltransferase [Elusimicrobiales bacterium]